MKSSPWWSWKISEEELKKQVDHYKELKIINSYRGKATLFIVFSMVITMGFSYFGEVDFDAIYISIIYLPLAFFVYKGHRWAIIVIMGLWTFDKGYQLYAYIMESRSILLPLCWWILVMGYFCKAFKIEIERRKIVRVVE